jgi:hypothetical protein
MRKIILGLVLILPLTACASNKISLPEVTGCNNSQSKSACLSYETITVLGLFQDAAIGANTQKLLSDAETKQIVTFVKNSVSTIQLVLNDWRAAVQGALAQLKLSLSAATLNKYQLYINLLSSLVGN